ncbi:MAG: Hpt domain-containing protein [Bacteroidota bacterium]
MSTNQLNKVTNLDYLTDLSKGNTAFINEMIGIFLIENPEEISWLEKGISLSDFELIKMAAHKMRSTIPFVGLDRHIEAEVAEIETLAASGKNIKKIKILFSKVKDFCQKARQELSPDLT